MRKRSFRFEIICIFIIAAMGIIIYYLVRGPSGSAGIIYPQVYSTTPQTPVYAKPSKNSKKIASVRHGVWINVLDRGENRTRVLLYNGKKGYIPTSVITDTWVKIHVEEKTLYLVKGKSKEETALAFPVSLNKNLPRGRFYISATTADSLELAYPTVGTARKSLLQNRISREEYHAIVKAAHRGDSPPEGRSIVISAEKSQKPGNTEAGQQHSIQLKKADLAVVLNGGARRLIMVDIYSSKSHEQEMNAHTSTGTLILEACAKMLEKGCSYTVEATQYTRLSFPMGDITPAMGVCTDLVIRSLRQIDMDLQAMVYEDILLNPRRHPTVKKRDPNIDHRRVVNLERYFENNAVVLTKKTPLQKPGEWLPGDIVIFDTGVENGTIYDHIGIVSSRKKNGSFLVYNLWTIGCDLEEMDILRGDYPKIVGHYRLLHPYYYHAVP
ncbi:MAG: DUF1287 domain-containing protein [bacterium]|nr:DUF1287 domain-containing protein [bacterium]